MDRISKEVRSRNMVAIKSESGIEVLPNRFKGLYFRRHPKRVLGNPDFGNKTRRLVVFIDGCFWHGCPQCYREPKSNIAFWRKKIGRNKSRDDYVTVELVLRGWRVYRIWEHNLNGLGGKG